MRLLQLSLIGALVLCFGTAFAAGIVNLKGKLRNFTETSVEVEVEVDEWLYIVSKKFLSEKDLKVLQKTKTKESIDFWVSFEGITDAHKLDLETKFKK